METYDTSFKNHTDYVDPLKYMDFAIYAAMLDYDNRQYVLLDSYHKLFISNIGVLKSLRGSVRIPSPLLERVFFYG